MLGIRCGAVAIINKRLVSGKIHVAAIHLATICVSSLSVKLSGSILLFCFIHSHLTVDKKLEPSQYDIFPSDTVLMFQS